MEKFRFDVWKLLPFWLIVLTVTAFANAGNAVSVVKVSEHTTQNDLSLCASLNKYLYSGDGMAAKPYIKLTPNHPFSVALSYNGICLKGLKPRTEYRFIIHRGIPLGEFKLDRDYTLSGKTTDYDPSLHFDDDGYILPSRGEISIPIETINVKELAVSLYRINTKNLIGKINDYALLRKLYSDEIEKIMTTEGFFLWERHLRIHSRANLPKVTAIPVGDLLKERKPGVYILKAVEVGSDGKPVNSYDIQTQWFMVSDIGLYTLKGDDGLTVYTRHLSDAKVYDNVKLELVSRNNELLDSAISKDGKAFFPANVLGGKRGLRPKAIYAYGEKDDFSVIDLSKPPFDLSDRGVQGRDNPGKYDAYVYSDRGIFRPGESVPVEILLRDSRGVAKAGMKLSLKLYDSRQTEVLSRLLTTDESGHISTTLKLSNAASTGRWHLKLSAGGEKAVGSLDFLVEDFVPPKIRVDIANAPSALKPGGRNIIELSAHYLTGEALPDADVELSTIIRAAKKPFKGYASYHFGDVAESFSNQYLKSTRAKTGQNGSAAIPLSIEKVPSTTLPLSAHITLSVSEPGGRPVEKRMDLFVEDKEGYIGIKADFENDAVDREKNPLFELVYLSDSRLESKHLDYRVIKEQVHWNWRNSGDDWTYNKTYSDAEEVAKGTLETSGSEPVRLKLAKLDWGTYRLEVEDKSSSGIVSSYRFSSGYEESAGKASPDRLPVSIDRQAYRVGEQVRVHIKPKFSGPITVSIANHTIIETQTVQAVAGEDVELVFDVRKEWGSSTYVLATAFRAEGKKLGASRAVGIAHITVKDPKKVIGLTLDYPHRTKSSAPLKVSVKADNFSGEKAYMVLAAVDEGILNLTNFHSPDPAKYFYGQQKLGIEIRDIYGDLIRAHGAHAQFDVGAGDELQGAMTEDVTVNRRKVVALFSGVVAFDKEGRAEVDFDIPDYQGSLRLMAVAWSHTAVGAQSGKLTVKDRISPEIYMPRFISVGDKAEGLLSIAFDKEAEAGEYRIRLISRNENGIISTREFHYRFEGREASRFSAPVDLHTDKKSDLTLAVEIIQDGNISAHREWELAVRSRYPEVSTRKVGTIAQNSLFDPQALFDTSLWSNPEKIMLKISGKPLIAASSLADDLIDYWGRCAEQTTSRAMPWLFVPADSPLAKSINIQAIVPQAVERLLAYQKLGGGFGLWSGSSADMWITAYVLDFLTRAKKAGYSVPDNAIRSGLNWIENHLDRWSRDGTRQEADAYGLYVLTRNGRTLMSEMLYRARDKKSGMRSSQAWGQLASALAYVGENDLALALFEKARKSLGSERNGYFANYGGVLRDEAALVVLMQESKLGIDWQSRYIDLASSAAQRRYLSTQESSLLLRAAFAANFKPARLKLRADGKELPLTNGDYLASVKNIQNLPLISSEGSGRCWYSMVFRAAPKADAYRLMPGNGFTIEKRIFTIDGKEADLSAVRQNERLVVVMQGNIQSSAIGHPLVTDWVPAGFELENPQINGIDPTTALNWLKKQSAALHTEYRNDRFIAALSSSGARGYFRIAYVVRAVTPGVYSLPPAKIEDMYRPYYRAVSQLYRGKVLVSANTVAASAPKKPANTGKLTERDFEAVYTRPVGSLSRYTVTQINYLRNAIFARAGLDYERSNPALYRIFSNYSWYHPDNKSSASVYASLTPLQKENVQKLLAEEKRRGGGLVLADFYRVRIKALSEKDLERYDRHQLGILRNSLFARRGVSFHNEEYRRIFSYMPWYHPTDVSSAEIFDDQMSELEKDNVRLIQKMERTAK